MKESYFRFDGNLSARGDRRLNNDTFRELWRGFTCDVGSFALTGGGEHSFLVGTAALPAIEEGSEYAISVTENGIALSGRDYPSLARAFSVLLLHIETEGFKGFRIRCCELQGRYRLRKRMIHFCVFPETSELFIRRCIRLAGVMQYTHVVLEFWGMLRFDCLRELAWSNAFTKEQAAVLVREIGELGMEAVPMFNHLGHAAACRVSGGKHVVLDQNPRLAPLFAPDGWSWNILSRETEKLLDAVRGELYELFPDSPYFHLGCDEVYSYEKGEEDQRRMREYLATLCGKVHSEGRQPILWGDMLLNRELLGLDESYFCSCDTPEDAEKLIDAIPKYAVIADWHYDHFTAPIETSLYFRKKGFAVLGVPWFEYENSRAHIDTAADNDLLGVMVSTWHTLAQKMPHIVMAAVQMGAIQSPWSGCTGHKIETETAALLRKVLPVHGRYPDAGWTEAQVFMQSRPMV